MAEVVDSIVAELIAKTDQYEAGFDRAIAKNSRFKKSIEELQRLGMNPPAQYAQGMAAGVEAGAAAHEKAAARVKRARKSQSDTVQAADKEDAASAKAAAKERAQAAKDAAKAEAQAKKDAAAAAKAAAQVERDIQIALAKVRDGEIADVRRLREEYTKLKTQESESTAQARSSNFLSGSRPTLSTGISGRSGAGSARASADVFKEGFKQEAVDAKAAATADRDLAKARDEAAAAATREAERSERLAVVAEHAASRGGIQRGSGAALGASVLRQASGQADANLAAGAEAQVAAEREVNRLLADQADLQAGLTVARGRDRDIIRDQLTELRLVNQYRRAGLTDEEAAVRAEERLAVIEAERAKNAERQKTAQVGQFAAGAGLGRFGGLNPATAGIAAAGALAAGVSAISSSIDFAKQIRDTADAVGLTTKQVQVYEAAARQAGVSTDQFRSGIGQLSNYLGRAKEGDEQAAKTFQLLGINIKNAGSAGDILPTLIDRISSIPDAATRAAVETRLFGEEGRRLDAVLSGGNEKVNELASAMERAGSVLSEGDIQRLKDAEVQLAGVKAQLQVDLAEVVANNKDAIVSLAKSFADLANSIGSAVKGLDSFSNSTAIGKLLSNPAAAGQATRNFIIDKAKSLLGFSTDTPPASAAAQSPAASLGKVQPGKVGDLSSLYAPKAHQPRGKSADQLAAEADARTKRFDDAMRQQQVQQLQAMQEQTSDELERSALAVEQINIERQTSIKDAETQADADVRRGADRKLTEERLTQLTSAINQTADQRIDAENLKDRISALNKATALANQSLGYQQEELQNREGLATTAAERRRIETKLLENAMQQERNTANNTLARAKAGDPSISAQDIASANLTLKTQPQRRASAQASINANNAGPGADFLRSLPTTADRLDEAFQNAAVDGLGALNDGITEAITGAKSLGDAFSDVSKQIISDLIKIAVQKEIVGPLANSLFGSRGSGIDSAGAESGALSAISAFSSVFGGARASGGNVVAGRAYLVGEHGPEPFVPSQSGTIIPNNRSVSMGGGSDAGAVTVHVLPGEYFDARVVSVTSPHIQAGVVRATAGGASLAQTTLQQRQRRSLTR